MTAAHHLARRRTPHEDIASAGPSSRGRRGPAAAVELFVEYAHTLATGDTAASVQVLTGTDAYRGVVGDLVEGTSDGAVPFGTRAEGPSMHAQG